MSHFAATSADAESSAGTPSSLRILASTSGFTPPALSALMNASFTSRMRSGERTVVFFPVFQTWLLTFVSSPVRLPCSSVMKSTSPALYVPLAILLNCAKVMLGSAILFRPSFKSFGLAILSLSDYTKRDERLHAEPSAVHRAGAPDNDAMAFSLVSHANIIPKETQKLECLPYSRSGTSPAKVMR